MTAEHKKIAQDAFLHDHRDEVYIVANRGYMDYGIALQVAGKAELVTTIRRQALQADDAQATKAELKAKAEAEKKAKAKATEPEPETPNAE
jgi:hypothetical protein